MELNVNIKQTLSLSPQLIQSMEILQMGTQELLEYIDRTFQENPVLEMSENEKAQDEFEQLRSRFDWLNQAPAVSFSRYHADDDDSGDYIGAVAGRSGDGESLCSFMLSQLEDLRLPEEYGRIAAFLIRSMDKNGYLDEEPEDIARHIGRPLEMVEVALDAVHTLEPAGACARNLSECLLLQLERRGITGLPSLICRDYLDALAKNRYNFIAKALAVEPRQVHDAADVIRTLDPRPGSVFDTEEIVQYINPDLIVLSYPDRFEVTVNDHYFPRLYISSYYMSLLKETQDSSLKDYLAGKMRQARWLVQSIEQRRSTLLSCSEEIVRIQDSFFKNGKGNLKPMSLTDIANLVNVHESTVSRAIKGKYILCTYGAYPLSYFFSRALNTGGDAISPDSAKALLRKIVDSEDKRRPYSDQKISELMTKDGAGISRRTVAKYRDELNIPSTVGRRQYE